MRVRVETERCQGHGVCVVTAPALFDFQDDGKAVAAERELSAADLDGARAAEASCPELAIVIEGKLRTR
ncbi:ferredoxin [Phytohabitans sp. ZYX-F-186]|uniref:Ferredoxin n=1 Tax=Phytohabitans maris TaxID=3071409 RepID=A0ABU0Z9S7_9ACTN|nr:ferredoxin [Phytohabitans sp. ZYX-F-186]MDQ7903798.1 ferredoxin [Phytohabitans sp. ZYX-F-186]